MPQPLTAKQEAFCQAYVANGLNGSAAAREAGYGNNPEVRASQLLRVRKVQDRLSELMREVTEANAKRKEDAIASATEVLERMTSIIRANQRNIVHVTKDGDPYIDLNKATDAEWEALSETTIEDFVVGRGDDARDVRKVKVKLESKLKGLELLARYHGLLKDKVEVSFDEDTAAMLEAGRKRALAAKLKREGSDE